MSRSRVVFGALLTLLLAALLAHSASAACILQADGWSGPGQYCWVALTDSAHTILLDYETPGCPRLNLVAPPDTTGVVGIAVEYGQWVVSLFYSDGRTYQVRLDCYNEPTWYSAHTIPVSCAPQSTGIGTTPKPQLQRDLRPAPNPTTRASAVGFTLNANGWVTAGIYDTRGRLVRSVVAAMMGAGPHTLRWDGANDDGIPCPPGQYFWKVTSVDVDRPLTTKVIVLR